MPSWAQRAGSCCSSVCLLWPPGSQSGDQPPSGKLGRAWPARLVLGPLGRLVSVASLVTSTRPRVSRAVRPQRARLAPDRSRTLHVAWRSGPEAPRCECRLREGLVRWEPRLLTGAVIEVGAGRVSERGRHGTAHGGRDRSVGPRRVQSGRTAAVSGQREDPQAPLHQQVCSLRQLHRLSLSQAASLSLSLLFLRGHADIWHGGREVP